MSANTVPPLIIAQLNHLISQSPFPIKVDQIWAGNKNVGLADRITLVIPFCLDYIKWDVIYNALYPLSAPDIIFGPESENFRPLQISGELKNYLANWNSKDPTKLLSLVLELRQLYMTYQRKRVEDVDDDRLKFEISTIMSREGIEMYMTSSNEKPEEVKFAVPLLGLDINGMIPGCSWRHQQKIYLQVIFPVGRKYISATSVPRLKLVSSPELKSLFSVEDFRLPSWLDGMCMAEYLPTLEELLQLQISDAISSIEARRKFIMALAPVFGRPLEAESVFCRKATCLGNSGVFVFLVHFSLPLQFPKQQPTLVLQSSQHFNSLGVPIKSAVITEFPWSPRWEPTGMVERIYDYLVEECLNFKKYCIDITNQQQR
ncbi:BRISC and BRCA1-A complex member 2 [Impatiens glandulifera]|uniref:BRISC and BRCA1-A complex member 2 n=1 Tax=Impatiens glandulifera TaxID=253017 RepID=UPI001FB13E7D|nr:BRISC and BRCA1-A complex member 2 [Impatiens glandulifera]